MGGAEEVEHPVVVDFRFTSLTIVVVFPSLEEIQ